MLGAFAMLVAVGPARAADSIDAKQRIARKACLAGDYAKGVELLADLFVETKNSTHIFNQGRCFEQNARYEEAISRFREYLRIGTDLAQEDIAIANQHIADCRALLGKPEAEAPRSVPAVPAAAPQPFSATSPPPATATSPGIDLTAAAPPATQPEADAPVYERWWFWTGLGAVVVAGTVTAVVLAKGGSATLTASSPLGTRAVFQ